MRRVLLVMLLILLSGCGSTQPTMAGKKWADALRDPDVRIRKRAAFTLGNIGSSDPAAFPALVGALKDRDASVRCEAILALLKFGPDASDALPALNEVCQKDTDANVRAYAAKAVEKIKDSN
jgi:HEAT repeat protein